MGWEQLIALKQERLQLAMDDATTPPEACWRDGEPLDSADDGGLFCRACGWRPDDVMGELRS